MHKFKIDDKILNGVKKLLILHNDVCFLFEFFFTQNTAGAEKVLYK